MQLTCLAVFSCQLGIDKIRFYFIISPSFTYDSHIIINKDPKCYSFTKLNDNCTATLLTKKHHLQGNTFVGVKMNFITYVAHIEDCEGWWLSSCHNTVAEHWLP